MPKKIPPPPPSGNPEKRNNSAQINDSKITYWFIPPEIGALPIPLIQKNILGVVATFTRNGGECWATDTQFGEAFQWSRQKINAAINGMVAAGWLRKDVTRLSNGTTPRRLWLAQTQIPLSPTVTSSTTDQMELVTHGDYPCHLRGLPLSPTVTTLVTHGDTNSNIIKKEEVIKSAVADAPSPSLSKPHRFVVSELTLEQRATLLALLDGPARLGGHDPEKVLDGLLADCQKYSNGGNDKKRFRPCWFETLKRQFVGKKIKDWAARPARPLGASGLTYQQQQTCFRDFWNEAHGLDRPDLSWVTKEQGAFLQKLMGRLCGTEAAYVEVLARKRSDQFDYQCRDFTNAIKELEQELAK